MSGVFDEIANEARMEARMETRIETAQKMLAMGKLTTQEIAECSGLTPDEVKTLQTKKNV